MKYKVHFCIVFLVLFSQLAHPQKPGWMHYRNERWGFCVAFPRNWRHDEGVNKAGIAIFLRDDSTEPQISVGALPNVRNNGHLLSLDENFAGEDETLRESGATDLVVLDQHNTVVGSYTALSRKIRFKDGSDGKIRVNETIAFQTPNGLNYYFELKCSRPELTHLERIFNEIVFNTFKINCSSQPTAKK